MNAHVLVQIAFLSKRLAAAEDWTYKRLLLSVWSQMVEKIVPFLKASLASFEFTEEYLCPALALWFKVLNILECTEIWHVETLLKSGEIDISAFLKEHFSIVWNADSVHNGFFDIAWIRDASWNKVLLELEWMAFCYSGNILMQDLTSIGWCKLTYNLLELGFFLRRIFRSYTLNRALITTLILLIWRYALSMSHYRGRIAICSGYDLWCEWLVNLNRKRLSL